MWAPFTLTGGTGVEQSNKQANTALGLGVTKELGLRLEVWFDQGKPHEIEELSSLYPTDLLICHGTTFGLNQHSAMFSLRPTGTPCGSEVDLIPMPK